MSENDDEKGFVIKDKRRFDEGGKAREEAVEEQKETVDVKEKQDEEKPEASETTEEYALPEINFPSFLLSLHTSAMFQFGDIADPVSKKKVKNLAAVKQTIDILDMLKKKTAGNLEDDEGKLLDGILFELRMRYVKESAKS